MKIFLGDKRF